MEGSTQSPGYGLKSPSSQIRLQALGRIGDSRITDYSADVLTLMKEDGDPAVKARSAWVLGRLRYRKAYPDLVANLKHRLSQVRIWSAWALGELGHYRACDPLMKAINEEQEDSVKRAIGGALKTLNFESTRIHRSQVLQALSPPGVNDAEIMGMVAQLEKLTFPQDHDEIIALRSRIKAKNPTYLAQYMSWVGRKPGLMAMLDDNRRVFS